LVFREVKVKAIKIWGGLGNQMFEYVFSLYLKERFHEEVYFYQVKDRRNPHVYSLSKYNTHVNILPFENLSKYFLSKGNSFLYRIERRTLLYYPFVNRSVFIEPSLHFQENIHPHSIVHEGYWQSYRYLLQSFESTLKNDFVLKENPWNNHPVLHDIENSNSVSLHIRRGDYLKEGNTLIYAQCSLAYYEDAVERILSKAKNPHLFVFSNDIVWAYKNLKFKYNVPVTYIDNNDVKDNTHLDFLLMRKCKHNIIANSTFSWWAAWLNENPDKMIFAPIEWYVGKMNDATKELIPTNWFRI
jgi:hypothetical protein